MDEHPVPHVRTHVLADGRTVTVRPLRADDDSLERRFLKELSGESRYFRFHNWVSAPSDNLIHFLTDIDQERHIALLCTTATDAAEELAGEARYAVDATGKHCEFGIVIGERWHKSGVAGLLMDALMREARERGVEVMEGHVLANNRQMLRFARALGFEIEPVPDDRSSRRIVKRLS
jgi:acetyltransferase